MRMIAELMYLPTLLLICLGNLLLDDSGPSDDTVGGGTLVTGEDGSADPVDLTDPLAPATTQLDNDLKTFERSASDESVFAGDGDDINLGGSGDDSISASIRANTIYGDLGTDKISSLDAIDEATSDTVNGRFSNDMMLADSEDIVAGGNDDDSFALPVVTSTENPVIITDYSDDESLIIELPNTLLDDTASAELSDRGLDTEIKVGTQTIAILQGFTNIDALDAQFVVSPSVNDAGRAIAVGDTSQTLAGTPTNDDITTGAGNDKISAGDSGDIMSDGNWTDTFVVETVDAGDAVVTVTDFNVAEDQLQVGEGGTLTFVAANDGADTTVLVNGIAVFLLQGVTPAEMEDATVTNAA